MIVYASRLETGCAIRDGVNQVEPAGPFDVLRGGHGQASIRNAEG
ncbi:hypothetical protein [Dyella silvatica]|nr:hypothetical protein [Dyella silvatica]